MKDIYKDLPVLHIANTWFSKKGKQIRCVIFGNFGAYNYGDEAILAGQLQDLRSNKSIQTTVIARYPEQTKELHGVEAISQSDIVGIVNVILHADRVVVGGGGLFCKNERGLIGLIFQLYILLLFMVLPLIFGKKVFVWGVGFYEDTNAGITSLVALLSKFTTIFSVRDYYSFSFSQKKGIQAELYKDNSFLMDLLPKTAVLEHPFFKGKYSTRKTNIGIAIKQPRNSVEQQILLKQLAKFIEEKYQSSYFWFYSMDTHPRYSTDKAFSQKIIDILDKNIKEKVVYSFMPTDWHPQLLFSSYKLMDYCITVRLHAAIFCYRNRIPFFGISYGQKTTTFLESIGKQVISIQEISVQKIQRAMKGDTYANK